MSGRLQHVDEGYGASNSVIKNAEDLDVHYATCDRANMLWNFNERKDSNFMDLMGSNGKYPLYNKICYAGMTFYSNIPSVTSPGGHLTHMTINRGHWGPNQGPGCQAIYMGGVARLPDFKYETSGKYTIVP